MDPFPYSTLMTLTNHPIGHTQNLLLNNDLVHRTRLKLSLKMKQFSKFWGRESLCEVKLRSINLNSITFIIIIIGRTHGNSRDYLQGLNSSQN